MQSIRRTLALVWILCACLAACAPVSTLADAQDVRAQDWQPGDLRQLDAIDSTSAEYDLIAAYLRLQDADLQIRLDLLENVDPLNYDVHVALDFLPGGGGALPFETSADFGWDVILNAPANHEPDRIVRDSLALPQALPRVVRDSALDCITLSVPSKMLEGNRQVAVLAWISRPDESTILDILGPFRLEDSAPARAPLLLEFRDALPASSPAQLLRRWDGAHTGPYGQRHGLRYLLLAAQANHVPLTLLDLAQPESLRGLALVNGLELVQRMNASGLLTLPANGYSVPEFSDELSAYDWRVASRMGIKSAHAAYGLSQTHPMDHPNLIYAVLQDPTHIQQFERLRFIPSLQSPQTQATSQTVAMIDRNGLTTAAVRWLLESALSPDPADLVLLDGSLPESPWSDLSVAQKAMQYIAGHPWIQALSGVDLANFPVSEKHYLYEILACTEDALCTGKSKSVPVVTPYGMVAANRIDSSMLAQQLYQAIAQLPADPFADSAREMFAALTQPATDERLAQFNASALTQVGYLIAASRWNSRPVVQAQCDSDPDWDGYPECILSNEFFFAILDPEGGRVAFAAARKDGRAFQLVGPTSQTSAARSDPDGWRAGLGTLADPEEIPGAFADPPAGWAVYTAHPGENRIMLADESRGITRTLALDAENLEIRVQNDTTPHLLPLLLSAFYDAEFDPSAQLEINSDRIRWPLAENINAQIDLRGVEIESHAGVSDSIPLLQQSEDPDRAYPQGHYLPFPFFILKLGDSENLVLTISLE